MATADRRNLDLRIAESRIREARAVHGIAAADLFPQIDATGDAYLFDSRIPHRYRNIGTERCSVVSACTPPYL